MKVERNDIDKLLISKDIEEIRAFLNNCLLWNASDIDTIRSCVNKFSKVEGVFDRHDNEELNKNKERYTSEYLIDLNTELTFNFSKERYLHALEVANYLEMKNLSNKRNVQPSNNNIVYIKVGENKKKKNSQNQMQTKKNKSSLVFQVIVGAMIVAIIIILIIIFKSLLLEN